MERVLPVFLSSSLYLMKQKHRDKWHRKEIVLFDKTWKI